MKASLKPGVKRTLSFKVTDRQTVPHIYRESALLQTMPEVFGTPFMVGLFEWACTELLAEHLDAGEGSVGTHVDFTHDAATPPGMTVTVEAECVEVDGARVRFRVKGHDGIDSIGAGEHERFVVKWDKFNARVAEKAKRALATAGAS